MATLLMTGCDNGSGEAPAAQTEPAQPAQPAQPAESVQATDNWPEQVGQWLTKNDIQALQQAEKTLLAVLADQPQNPQAQLQLGLTYYRQALLQTDAQRQTLETLYARTIEHLEQAKTLLPQEQQPFELYQALWTGYRNLAFMPITFDQGVDPDYGVVPVNMKQMRQALTLAGEAKTHYTQKADVISAAQAELQKDLSELDKVYVANAERQWNQLNQTGGYRDMEKKRDN
jgi:tetratricopeptide (TPR) repeat protein